ncbi:hypothetical protein K490DRAFT_62423 [Saccharata proteae CBS 121410]|uniref:Uncharacterized protein n=1 Tax=Saccharata proteae CBS 121410 TaxID=1314787 RepID=A0A9P4I2Q9_9PEZI|nr:hypothetical protein K490DRAFT_62423 [Saccharata proteae CBS 121410]
MSSPTESSLSQTSPASADRRESIFLALAPVSSSNYPVTPMGTSPINAGASDGAAPVSPTEELASPAVKAPEMSVTKKERRSSSVSSNSSSGAPFKFLKLGPVHFGGEPGGSDFAEVDE